MLVGLSAKNAILIVEFARELEFAGARRSQAAIEASRLRLRPILMTSLAFIMGVVPLVISTGAGAEMRHAMGVAVFAGMIGVTLFGIFLTPVFYVLLRALTGNGRSSSTARHRTRRRWPRRSKVQPAISKQSDRGSIPLPRSAAGIAHIPLLCASSQRCPMIPDKGIRMASFYSAIFSCSNRKSASCRAATSCWSRARPSGGLRQADQGRKGRRDRLRRAHADARADRQPRPRDA